MLVNVFNNMYSGNQYKMLCFHLKVFFKGVLKFSLLDHQKRGPTARGPVTFTSHCICFRCGWKRGSFMLVRVDFTCWYIPWSFWPGAGWLILPVEMVYFWLLNHVKKEKKKAILAIFNIFFACLALPLSCINCASESTYTRSLVYFGCKTGYCYSLTGFALVWGPFTKKNWVSVHSINNPLLFPAY